MRQVFAFARQINASKIDHYQFLAKLQGWKLDADIDRGPSSTLSVEQEQKADEYLKRINARARGKNV